MINLTPWFHAMGAIGYLNGLVMGGTTTVIHMRFDPVAYVEDAVATRSPPSAAPRRCSWRSCRCPASPTTTGRTCAGSPAAPPRCRCRSSSELQQAAQRRHRGGLRADRGDHAGHRQPELPLGHAEGGHGRRPGVRHRDHDPAARRRRPAARRRAGRGLHPGPAGDARLRPPARGHRGVDRRRRLVPHRRRRRARRGRLPVDRRPDQGHAALQGLQRLPARAGGDPVRRPRGGRRRGRRAARRGGRRAARRLRRPHGRRRRRRPDRGVGHGRRQRQGDPRTSGCATSCSSTPSRSPRRARCSNASSPPRSGPSWRPMSPADA